MWFCINTDIICMPYIIAHAFGTCNISYDAFHRIYFDFPREERRENDQKQVDDKKYACTG